MGHWQLIMLKSVREDFLSEINKVIHEMNLILNKDYKSYTIYDDIHYYELMDKKESLEKELNKFM